MFITKLVQLKDLELNWPPYNKFRTFWTVFPLEMFNGSSEPFNLSPNNN